jgi:prophage antirepressor-like protein
MEYRSLIGVKPGNGASWFIADDIAECLAMLTPGQLDAVNRLCTEFSLHFADMDSFFDFVLKTKDLSREKFKREGIPAPKSKGDV